MELPRRALILVILGLSALTSHLGAASPLAGAETPSRDGGGPRAKTVCLTIDYGDGFQKRYPSVPWKAQMTIADVLQYAQKHPRGIRIVGRGKGETAMLTAIDGLENQGSRGKNWLFRVNDKLGTQSYAATRLAEGDAVLWAFDEYK